MFGEHFYNERIRRSVAVFGSLFDNLYVLRKSGDTVVSQVKVPISYGPKRKFLERIAEMENGEEAERLVAIKLPRMSFEIISIAYDPQRQLPKTNYFQRDLSTPSDSSKRKLYVGVPYIISFQLNIYAKTQDDVLQVVEQILPYFNPQYNVAVRPLPNVSDYSEDVPVILNSVSFSDDYEGAMEQRRTITYILDFDMKVGFYGPANGSGTKVIRQIDTNYFNMDFTTINTAADSAGFLEGISYTLNPIDVGPDSDFTLIWTGYDSAKPW